MNLAMGLAWAVVGSSSSSSSSSPALSAAAVLLAAAAAAGDGGSDGSSADLRFFPAAFASLHEGRSEQALEPISGHVLVE
jgi:hypothetical protein